MKKLIQSLFLKLSAIFLLLSLSLTLYNCEPPAKPQYITELNANFNAYLYSAAINKITIYAGDSIRFQSTTLANPVKGRYWNFPGGIPGTGVYSNDEPITKFIKYPTPGTYNVSLVVIASIGDESDTVTRTAYIEVLPDTNSNSKCDSTVTDIDGNVYKVVKIGSQCWMQQNLKTTRYNIGGTIPSGLDATTWSNDVTGAYAYYNNNPSYITSDGLFYNNYAVATGKLCPVGWHIPSKTEFETLISHIGGDEKGGDLKIDDTFFWYPPNTGATNSSGFTALGSGFRVNNGSYYGLGLEGHFWSSTASLDGGAYNLYLKNDQNFLNLEGYPQENGFSCRCLKD